MSGIGAAISVVLADDHAVFLDGLEFILNSAGFVVVGTAGDSVSAAALVRRHTPDLAVLDMNMPGGSASALVRQITLDSPRTRVALLSMQTSPRHVAEMEALGVAAYVSKVVDAATVCSVLAVAARSTSKGAIRVTPGVAGPPPEAQVVLATDDVALLAHLADGKSNTGIATATFVSEATVKRRLAKVYRELGVTTRTEAVTRGFELGLISDRGH